MMRTRTIVVFVLALGVMVVAGGAFLNKMVEFVFTMAGSEVAGFGAVAVVTYLCGMVPLLCLTLWGVFSGHFRDVERPATRMLELHRQLEASGERYHG
jgi:nitrogen fixation-related uncharacterized protein